MYEDAGVSVTAYQGDDITDAMMDTAFYIYKSTIDKVRHAPDNVGVGFDYKYMLVPEI